MKTCIECGEPVDLKPGQEIPGVGKIGPDVADADICAKCLAKGWSEAWPDDFANDPDFILGIPSPIQRHDL